MGAKSHIAATVPSRTHSRPPHELLVLVLILCNFLSAYYTAFCIEASTKRYHWFYRKMHATDISWYAVWYSCQTLALLVSITNVLVIWAMGVRVRGWALRALTGYIRRGSIQGKHSDSEGEKCDGDNNIAGWVVGGERADEEVVTGGDAEFVESDEEEDLMDEDIEDEEEEVEEFGNEKRTSHISPYLPPAASSTTNWRQVPAAASKYTSARRHYHHHHHHHHYHPQSQLNKQHNSPLPMYQNHRPTCPFTISSFLRLLELRVFQLSEIVSNAFYSLSGGKRSRICGSGIGRRKVVRVVTAGVMLSAVGIAAWQIGFGPFWLTTMVNLKRTDRAVMIRWNG
ncbi:hypothetical protein DFH27DRAFT_604992 [Peziza echinospora]|nr:hypothetical protein DFH27DRAFT_604992 [Peziza echinospora]